MIDRDLLTDAVHYLRHWLDYRQRTLQLPGLVAAVAYDGELLLQQAYGLADVEASVLMTPEYAFPVASHSKTFTTALVLRLVEQEVLRLDDAIGRWVPGVPEELQSVHVGELLSHSAGVTRDSADCDFWQLDGAFPDGRQLLEKTERVLGRHERMKYTNIGFGLLGLVVEAACSSGYDAVARRELIDVLGLSDTTTDTAGRVCATGYSARHGGKDRRPLALPSAGALAPATGYVSTAADLCAFATALCGEGLLSADSRREMQRVAWVGENGDQDYCLGLSRTPVGERVVHGHGGAYPGFITSTLFVAADQLVAVVLANAIDAPSGELAKTMLAVIDHAQGCGPSSGEQLPTGRYVGLWGVSDVVRFGDRLLVLDPELPDPLERRTELERASADTWTIVRSSSYGSPGESVVFAGDTCRFAGMTLTREQTW